MNQTFPKYALIAGNFYTFVKLVRPALPGSSEPVVICDHKGEEFYVSESLWIKASENFKERAREAGTVTSQSSAQEKIALFRSLFKGRADVHAHGFRRKDGGIGYTPACANEWKPGVCPRAANAKAKCVQCSHRAFSPLSDSAIIRHFQGNDERFRDVIGLYVLDERSNTSVLVIDFDKEGWQEAVSAVRAASQAHGINAYVERSRSGNGGHVWFFFEQAIGAKLARDFGSALIAEAMANTRSISFEAYDRMLPAQSTIPEGGFGNLIAAPFQGRAQRADNSVFVDDSFTPFPDQWLFLSKVKKLSEQAVLNVVGASMVNSTGSTAASAPWEHQPAKPLSRSDFPDPLVITESDMIYIPQRGLSAAAENRIKRLAAFSNPEFFKKQALHRSVYGTPRIAYLGETRDEHIAIPRGCKQKLLNMLRDANKHFTWSDKHYIGSTLQIDFTGKLRPDQQFAVEQLAKHDNGILSAPTGFGKTVIGAYLIAQHRVPTLIIVPKTALVSQWVEKLGKFLAIEHPGKPLLTPSGKPSKRKRPVVGQIGGGKNRISGIVDVATFQSLVKKDPETGEPQAKELIRNYGLVICDECHHAAAPQLELILKSTPAKYVYGLSATPQRADGLDRALFMLCGPIRCKIDPKEQAKQQGIKRLLRPRFTRIRLPKCENGVSYNQLLDSLCQHSARNTFIANDVASAVKNNRKPLVLTKRKEHARVLAELISKAAECKTHLLVGEGAARQRRERLASAIKDSASSNHCVIVATESYLGEGFDASALDALFLTTPISWDGNVTQQAGRLHRTNEGKTNVVIYDYVDETVPMLERMYKKRLKTYAKLGYEVAVGDSKGKTAPADFIFPHNAMKMLASDINDASLSVDIIAPYTSPKAVNLLLKTLASAKARGVTISCTVAKEVPESTREAFARNGILLTIDTATKRAGLAVFDKQTVWYGTLPLLAFPQQGDCSIRFTSAEAAHELLEQEANAAQ